MDEMMDEMVDENFYFAGRMVDDKFYFAGRMVDEKNYWVGRTILLPCTKNVIAWYEKLYCQVRNYFCSYFELKYFRSPFRPQNKIFRTWQ